VVLTSGRRQGRLAGGGKGRGTAGGGRLTEMVCGRVERRRIGHQRVEDAGSVRAGSFGAPWCSVVAPCWRSSGRRGCIGWLGLPADGELRRRSCAVTRVVRIEGKKERARAASEKKIGGVGSGAPRGGKEEEGAAGV
jgi:hypothetical protein